jgi:predicted nucleic acid-binding protein
MTNDAFPVASYNFTPDDELMLDANIWLLVYGPQKPQNSRVNIYSQALAKILQAQSRIYIDVLIVSEFMNACARLKWNIMGKPSGDFKKFRKSRDFKPIAEGIAEDIRRILAHCTRVENDFETLDIEGLITEYAEGNSDFNDQVIAALCRKRGFNYLRMTLIFVGKASPS